MKTIDMTGFAGGGHLLEAKKRRGEDAKLNNHSTARRAFTLAEVLIVLAIIGIVAAMTIPTLLRNWQEKRWETAKDVFENRITEATSRMNSRSALTGYSTTEEFINGVTGNERLAGLRNVMKIHKYCDTTFSDCFVSDKISEFSAPTGFAETRAFTLDNGTNVIISYNPNCRVDPAATGHETSKGVTLPDGTEIQGCVSALYDTNGFAGPNEIGKDIQPFNQQEGIASSCGGAKCSGCPTSWGCCNGLCIGPEFAVPGGWAGANAACTAAGGRLPTSGIIPAYGGSPMPPGSETEKIGQYCKQGGITCSPRYWLLEKNTGLPWPGCLLDGSASPATIGCGCVISDNYHWARCVK